MYFFSFPKPIIYLFLGKIFPRTLWLWVPFYTFPFVFFIFNTILCHTFYIYNYIPPCNCIKCIFPWLVFSFFFNFYFGWVFLYLLFLSLFLLKAVINKVTGGVFGGVGKSLNFIVIY